MKNIPEITTAEFITSLRGLAKKHGPSNVNEFIKEVRKLYGYQPTITWDPSGRMFMGMMFDPRPEHQGQIIQF